MNIKLALIFNRRVFTLGFEVDQIEEEEEEEVTSVTSRIGFTKEEVDD